MIASRNNEVACQPRDLPCEVYSIEYMSAGGPQLPSDFFQYLLLTSLLFTSDLVLLVGIFVSSNSARYRVCIVNMVDFEESKQAKIKWGDGDVEAANLRRRGSISEMSIRSIHSRRASIDPAVALPPTFRTLSYQIDDAQGPIKSQKGKDNAAKGLFEFLSDRTYC